MYINFTFADGSNPYICTSNKKLWDMINRYCVDQTGETSFCVLGHGEVLTLGKRLSAYQKKQAVLRDFAIEWQYRFADFCYSWGELADWQDFFCEYGKKYGLLREFRENAIC